MAIFHITAKVISRGKGQSAIAAAAYRSGEKLHDHQTGETKDYRSRAERIQFEGVFAPQNAPEWAKSRESLWNHVEAFEHRKNSQLARELEVSLPHEFTDQQREWLLKDFIREQFTRNGFVVDAAIHAPDKNADERNYHAHIMVTMRRIDGQEFESHKDRSLNSKEQLSEWREEWANLANRHLERHGHEARIDHRSLAAQGIDREPTIHLGYAASAMLERGAQSDRVDQLAEILSRNDGIRLERTEERSDAGRTARDGLAADPDRRGADSRFGDAIPSLAPSPALDDEARKRSGGSGGEDLDWTHKGGMAAQQRSATEWAEAARAREDTEAAKTEDATRRGEVSERTLAAAARESSKEKTGADAERQAKLADMMRQMRENDSSRGHDRGRERTRDE